MSPSPLVNPAADLTNRPAAVSSTAFDRAASPLTTPWPQWVADNATRLDQDATCAAPLLPALAQAGLLRIGVPSEAGGDGGDVRDAIGAIAEVAEQSVTAAFVYWGQRAFIDYVLASANPLPRDRWLPALLQGRLAGAVGLSNAMKYLSQMEPLQVQARQAGSGWCVNGVLPWVTNLRLEGFVVAVAVQAEGLAAPMVLGIESGLAGVERSADLDLLALRASNTAAIRLRDVAMDNDAVLAREGPPYLRAARPAFLGMQCALSIGLARASLRAARETGGARAVLAARIGATEAALVEAVDALFAGLVDGRFVGDAVPLFGLRMRFAALVQEALQLELQASGGRAYLVDQLPGFGRRWRESAFIPVVTPSLTQLQSELERHGIQNGVAR